MASNHTRNTDGMTGSLRCKDRNKQGGPCGAPALDGRLFCRHHDPLKCENENARKRAQEKHARIEEARYIAELAEIIEDLMPDLGRQLHPDTARKLHDCRRGLRKFVAYKRSDDPDFLTLRPGYVAPAEAGATRTGAEPVAAEYGDRPMEEIPDPIDVTRDRALGALVGLALGEQMGRTLEGWKRDGHVPVKDLSMFDHRPLPSLQWGAGTAATLALADSLFVNRKLDETHFMECLTDWHLDGKYSCLENTSGIGKTLDDALDRYFETEDPIAGIPDSKDFDNASLIRSAPVAIRYWNNRKALRDTAARQCRTTHGNPAAVDVCVAFTEIVADAIAGASRENLFAARERAPGDVSAAIVTKRSWNKGRHKLCSDNNFFNAFEAAMWCVEFSPKFEEAVILATNLAGNSSAVAALAGQLAGAFYGLSAISKEWLERLEWREYMKTKARALFRQSDPRKRKSR